MKSDPVPAFERRKVTRKGKDACLLESHAGISEISPFELAS